MPHYVRLTLTWNVGRAFTVACKNSCQIILAQRKRTDRRGDVKNGKRMRGKGVNSKGGSCRFQFTARCDKTRRNTFFFPTEKERKCARRRGGEERGGRGLTFFKGIINSRTALVL